MPPPFRTSERAPRVSSTLGAVLVSDSGICGAGAQRWRLRSADAVSRTYSSPNGLSNRTWAVVPWRSVMFFSILIVTEAWKLTAEMLVISPTTSGPTQHLPLDGKVENVGEGGVDGVSRALTPPSFGSD